MALGSGPEEGRGVGGNGIPVPGSEELVHRLPKRLAGDVPQRDVRPGDHLHTRSLPAVIGQIAVHLLPEPLALQRILADQSAAQPFETDRAT
jgi:hypothetical protein